MSEADSYSQLARDYDWLVGEELRDGSVFFDAFARALDQLDPGTAVLDCACGTGWTAIALARRGFTVVGADASRAMIEVARANAAASDIAVDLRVATWLELPKRVGNGRFDAAVCTGNSIVHAGGKEEITAAFVSMRATLRPRGWLLLDSRDWEDGWTPGRRVDIPDRFERRDNERCLPIRTWDTPADFAAPHELEFLFIFETADGTIEARSYHLQFRPFRLESLTDSLTRAGFSQIDARRSRGWLTITARRD